MTKVTNKKGRPRKNAKKAIAHQDNIEANEDQQEDEYTDKFSQSFVESDLKIRKGKQKCKKQLSEAEKIEREKEQLKKRTCTLCNMVFSIPKGLVNHQRVKHTFEKPYECQICGEKFSIQSTYALHRRRHLGIKPHLCNICGKTFLRKTDLRIHMQTHNKVLNIKCDLCPNAYNSVVSLKKHKLIIHTDPSEWRHECKMCGKKCVSSTTLNLHLKQHSEDRSFKCHICGKGFYTNQNVKVHVRTHSADTKYNCELCPNGYRSNEALQRHLLKVHNVGQEKRVSSPKYFCCTCDVGFLQKARLEKHVHLHQTGEEERPFECIACQKKYKDKNFFEMHMKNKHSIDCDSANAEESVFKDDPGNTSKFACSYRTFCGSQHIKFETSDKLDSKNKQNTL